MVAALRVLSQETDTTYYASSNGATVTLSRYSDQDVCDICHGKIHTPDVGEVFTFPREHLRDVITTLCEVLKKSEAQV